MAPGGSYKIISAMRSCICRVREALFSIKPLTCIFPLPSGRSVLLHIPPVPPLVAVAGRESRSRRSVHVGVRVAPWRLTDSRHDGHRFGARWELTRGPFALACLCLRVWYGAAQVRRK